jgi:hypothetical protein
MCFIAIIGLLLIFIIFGSFTYAMIEDFKEINKRPPRPGDQYPGGIC